MRKSNEQLFLRRGCMLVNTSVLDTPCFVNVTGLTSEGVQSVHILAAAIN